MKRHTKLESFCGSKTIKIQYNVINLIVINLFICNSETAAMMPSDYDNNQIVLMYKN